MLLLQLAISQFQTIPSSLEKKHSMENIFMLTIIKMENCIKTSVFYALADHTQLKILLFNVGSMEANMLT